MSEPSDIPLADCASCEHNWPNSGVSDGPGHCYMFREKPGDRCGQFKPLHRPPPHPDDEGPSAGLDQGLAGKWRAPR